MTDQSPLLTIFLPLALAVIMLGLGLSLTLQDFRRVARHPKPLLVALLCQAVLLPLLCFGLAKAFALAPALAVGLMVLAASPGGAMASVYSHLAHGDVALNISLTAANSLLSVATLPVVVNLSHAYFMGAGTSLPLQFGKILQVFAIVLVPVAVGMALRTRRPSFARRMNPKVRILSLLLLVGIVALAVYDDRALLARYLPVVGFAALTFNLISLLAGYAVPRLLGIAKRQAIAISLEIGVHNGALAIAVAMSPALLGQPVMAVPGAIYSLIMLVTAPVFGWLVGRGDWNSAQFRQAP